MRGALVTIEVALAFILLTGAGLLIRSFQALNAVETGVDSSNVLTMNVPFLMSKFQEGSQEIVSAKDTCIQNMADVKVEFETYVRELVSVPTVQEIKGGNTVTVARMDFGVLREAIEALNPDDRESLLNKVSNAEKKVDVKSEPRKKTK